MNRTLVLNPPFSLKYQLISKWRFNLRVLGILGFLLIIFLLVFYVFQVNEITRGGFLISDYERKIAELSQQNKNLEISFSQHNFLEEIEARLKNSNYVSIDKVHFIQVLDSQIAVNPVRNEISNGVKP